MRQDSAVSSPSGNGPLHPESDFRAAMVAAGLDFPGDIIPDGQLHRIKVNGDRGPNSWYVLHLPDEFAGLFDSRRNYLEQLRYYKTATPQND